MTTPQGPSQQSSRDDIQSMTPCYRFDSIAAQQLPLVIQCSAGKDRTGCAVALLLQALGVPYETAQEDYLLSNTAMDYEQFILSRQTSDLGLTDAQHPLLQIPHDQRRVLFSADPAFLQAAFDEVHARFGTLHAYLNSVGVTPETLTRVRDALLTHDPDEPNSAPCPN